MILSELLEETYRRYWKGSKDAQKSWRNGQMVIEAIGDLKISEVEESHIDKYVDSLRNQGKKAGTINRKLAALSRMLIHASRMRYIDRVPSIIRVKEPKGRVCWLTHDEEAELLALPMDDWMGNLIVVLLDTGMRLGEALKLHSKDVDAHHKLVHLWDTKNGDSRSVPLTVRALDAIRFAEGQVFPHSSVDCHRKWDVLRAAMNRSDDPHFVFHMLRHTCASRLVQGGVQIPVIQQWLGHTNIQTTMRYAHISPDNLSSAREVLEK